MLQNEIEAFLQQKIGIAAKIIGTDRVKKAIAKRCLAANLPDIEAYWYHLQSNAFELNQLIELVVIPETWFFRDWYPFNFLNDYVASEWFPAHHGRPLRVLSVACASGEEPYSIAMMLLNSGMKSSQFVIDGLDISQEAIHKAQQGIYTDESFKGNNLGASLEFQRRYFTVVRSKTESTDCNKKNIFYQLNDEIKSCVNFGVVNLLDPYFLHDTPPYDLIFCRNVLMYFDDVAQQKAIRNIHQILGNQGLLFVGHIESSLINNTRLFNGIRHPLTFGYRKKSASETRLEMPLRMPLKIALNLPIEISSQPQQYHYSNHYLTNYLSSSNQICHQGLTSQNLFNQRFDYLTRSMSPYYQDKKNIIKPIVSSSGKRPFTSTTEPTADDKFSGLANAQELADRGYLNQARDICKDYIKHNTTDANAYVLLGRIYQAQGMYRGAIENFEKALYLDPDQYDALLHLTLIRENSGNPDTSHILKPIS
jgi:chemotaxis protein methyltransferase WspC